MSLKIRKKYLYYRLWHVQIVKKQETLKKKKLKKKL